MGRAEIELRCSFQTGCFSIGAEWFCGDDSSPEILSCVLGWGGG
ncbi:hypothetical protein RISK_006792 [Rhodopirellula islandica]|uniref:Uncharacterized protein n=1 Tax=Rhodopirellula islandica TaxID=595434 RepID=A0A0J1B3M4_RHOIS|nr:hypothetical protein RISK_006792 [Rhodopirellula islandica]